jgi:mono/diheme cytochrome c family protein
VAGAEIYRDHCAVCHGEHGKPSSFGAHMYPDATAFASQACRALRACSPIPRCGR